MKKNRVLMIDDDQDLCLLLERELKKEHYEVTVCHDGETGMAAFKSGIYQLIVLDIMLPGLSGFDILSEIRKKDPVPILMLTAKDSEIDKVTGLRLGADDYLTKPFLMNEFAARVHSLVRRYTVLNRSESITDRLTFAGLEINRLLRTVHINGKITSLTAKEFDLLYFLAFNQGTVFTKEQIYNHVWNDEYSFDDRNIMSFISKLRKKIRNEQLALDYIQTIHGVGYRFDPEV